jgi:predicted nucleotide-binding protein
MNLDEAKRLLGAGGLKIKSESRLANDTGTQLKLESGQSVNVYDKGTFLVQGNNPEPTRKLLEGSGSVTAGTAKCVSRDVFVVYGHDQTAKDQLEAMLGRWDLNPIFLDKLPSEGLTIIEKLEKYQRCVNFGVVLATPDDEGHRVSHPDEKSYRVRQNVVLELGMLLAVLGRSRVAILLKNPDSIERPSDIQGLIYIPFKDRVEDAALTLAKEMNAQGLLIDLGKL